MPDAHALGFSEEQLSGYIGAADALESRGYAMRLLSVARLARRRRAGALGAVGGRGGPGVDARALADPVLAEVGEDFVAELALIRGCSDTEAGCTHTATG